MSGFRIQGKRCQARIHRRFAQLSAGSRQLEDMALRAGLKMPGKARHDITKMECSTKMCLR